MVKKLGDALKGQRRLTREATGGEGETVGVPLPGGDACPICGGTGWLPSNSLTFFPFRYTMDFCPASTMSMVFHSPVGFWGRWETLLSEYSAPVVCQSSPRASICTS